MLSIFYFSYWFCNDIGSLWVSLKKGTRLYFVGCPEFGETHSQKTRLPVLGTSTQMFRWKHSVGCPKFGETHSQKTRFVHLRTVAQRFPGFESKTFRRMSQIRQNSFPENTFARNRHCCKAFCSNNVNFLARCFWHIFIFILFESIYDVCN